jgi:hypothetical protein
LPISFANELSSAAIGRDRPGHDSNQGAIGGYDGRPAHAADAESLDGIADVGRLDEGQRVRCHNVADRKTEEIGLAGDLPVDDVAIGHDADRPELPASRIRDHDRAHIAVFISRTASASGSSALRNRLRGYTLPSTIM